jgi:hypothetical protein
VAVFDLWLIFEQLKNTVTASWVVLRERRFDVFTSSIGVLLKGWWEMNHLRGASAAA